MAESGMPTTYETKTTTTSSGTAIGIHPEYLRTIPGILKIVEIVLSFITFICAVVPAWGYLGGGWVSFVSITAFITTLIFFIFYLTGIYSRLPGPWTLIVLSIIVVICISTVGFSGGGWVWFVAMSSFVTVLIRLLIMVFGLYEYLQRATPHRYGQIWFLVGLCIIVIICINIQYFSGRSWVWTVSVSSFVTVLLRLLLVVFGLRKYIHSDSPYWVGIGRFWHIIVFSLLTLICVGINFFEWGGWVIFVACVTLVCSSLILALHLTGIHEKYINQQLRAYILSLITFICACVGKWGSGQGWTQFVTMAAMITTIAFVVLHVMNLISRIPGPWLFIEFVYYCVFTLFFLIAAIICAARGSRNPAIGAAAFFGFAATGVYGADTFFMYRQYRGSRAESTGTGTSSAPTQSPASPADPRF